MCIVKKSCILIVVDSLGVGEMDDAASYGDSGASTFEHVTDNGSLELRNLERFGFYKLLGKEGLPNASWTKLIPKSKGKSSVEGHWEMMGVVTEKKMPTFPDGFSQEILDELSSKIGRSVLYGKPASGTEIIDKLGERHIDTGFPIIYTSADSVMQIAAHEDIIPVKELYEICHIARQMMTGESAVARIIARPFNGQPGEFTRTNRRKDFPLQIPKPNNLLEIMNSDHSVTCIGRTADFFSDCCNRTDKPVNLEESMLSAMMYRKLRGGLIFLNLGDFDSKYGHRRDKQGYANELKKLDDAWSSLILSLGNNDLLLVTSDHGNDPTFTSHTDHTREKTFVLGYMKGYRGHKLENVEVVDISATICEYFDISPVVGKSFLDQITSKRKK
jgi:phosphopentomutase